jgi:hypothetical protein
LESFEFIVPVPANKTEVFILSWKQTTVALMTRVADPDPDPMDPSLINFRPGSESGILLLRSESLLFIEDSKKFQKKGNYLKLLNVEHGSGRVRKLLASRVRIRNSGLWMRGFSSGSEEICTHTRYGSTTLPMTVKEINIPYKSPTSA